MVRFTAKGGRSGDVHPGGAWNAPRLPTRPGPPPGRVSAHRPAARAARGSSRQVLTWTPTPAPVIPPDDVTHRHDPGLLPHRSAPSGVGEHRAQHRASDQADGGVDDREVGPRVGPAAPLQRCHRAPATPDTGRRHAGRHAVHVRHRRTSISDAGQKTRAVPGQSGVARSSPAAVMLPPPVRADPDAAPACPARPARRRRARPDTSPPPDTAQQIRVQQSPPGVGAARLETGHHPPWPCRRAAPRRRASRPARSCHRPRTALQPSTSHHTRRVPSKPDHGGAAPRMCCTRILSIRCGARRAVRSRRVGRPAVWVWCSFVLGASPGGSSRPGRRTRRDNRGVRLLVPWPYSPGGGPGHPAPPDRGPAKGRHAGSSLVHRSHVGDPGWIADAPEVPLDHRHGCLTEVDVLHQFCGIQRFTRDALTVDRAVAPSSADQ